MPGSGRRSALRLASAALVAVTMLSACAGGTGDGDDATTPGATGEPSAGSEGEPLVLDVVISNLQVTPAINRVPVDIGDEVTLGVTSDIDDTIHVHGVERRLVLTADERGVLEFTIPPGVPRGVYPVEAHDGGLLLFELRVR